MNKKSGDFTKLGPFEMKKIKGGILTGPLKTKWRCIVNGVDFDQCYSVQPQVPCSYPQACIEIGDCESTFDICEMIV